MAQTLEDSCKYRVLREVPSDLNLLPDAELPHFGVVLDTETTGLDAEIDQVIELGMIKFPFDSSGRIGPISARFQAFHDPGTMLGEEIVKLTGLTSADLEGHQIDRDAVADFIEGAALVIAHNANFDRPFSEQLSASFAGLPWACSATEIDWRAEGVASYRLDYLLQHFGYFHRAHRAIADCEALLFLLSHSLLQSGQTGFSVLLEAARRPTARIFAVSAPYEMRGTLKRRNYRWNDGQNGYPRAWWRDVDPDHIDNELAFLSNNQADNEVRIVRMTARDRFRSLAKT